MDEEQVGDEVIEKEVDMEKDMDAAGKPEKPEKNCEKNRPRSATKLEKERQNRLCRAQKQAERIKDAAEEDKSENVDNEVIEEKAEVEGMETKKVETRKIRKDSEGSSSQWETESEVVEEEEGKGEVSEKVDEDDKRLEKKVEEKEKEEKNDEKEMREETKRLAAKIRSAGRRNRRKSSKGSR